MTEIDWDELLSEVENTPRAMLAEVLAQADNIKNVVIVFHDQDGKASCWCCTESGYHAVAMLEYAKWEQLQRVSQAGEAT